VGEPSWGADAVTVAPGADEPSSPLFDADGGWAGAEDDEKVFDFADEPSGQVALPHWTEPGTGELPRILAGSEGDAPATSGSTPAVHWRSHDGAWSGDEEGFADLADDDDVRLGALDLDRPHEADLYDLRRARRRGGRARRPAAAARRRARHPPDRPGPPGARARRPPPRWCRAQPGHRHGRRRRCPPPWPSPSSTWARPSP
jgi:hypothetical protein